MSSVFLQFARELRDAVQTDSVRALILRCAGSAAYLTASPWEPVREAFCARLTALADALNFDATSPEKKKGKHGD